MSREDFEPDFVSTRRMLTASAAIAAVALGGLVAPNMVSDYHTDQQMAHLKKDNHEQRSRLSRASRYLGAMSGGNAEAITGTGLMKVEELSGYDQKVESQERKKFEASSVKLVYQAKNGEPYIIPKCTGTKVSVAGEARVLTARHCFEDQDPRFIPSGGKGGVDIDFPNYANIAAVSDRRYGVTAQGDALANASTVNFADGIAIDLTGNTDWALLNIAPGNPDFDKIPAIDTDKILTAEPVPGEEVALRSMPDASNNLPISATGVYLGRLSQIGNEERLYDYVGIMASTRDEDTCNFGASGSSNMFASGGYSGPLNTRSTLGYGGRMEFSPEDSSDSGIRQRLELEQRLGVDLLRFTTICGFSVAKPDTLRNLEQEITDPTPLKLIKQPVYSSYK